MDRAEPGEGVVALDRSDVEGLPLDLRATNSWTQALDEVDPAEALETHAINALAPLLLTQRLLPAVRRSEAPDKHLVFVSAVEGQFSYGSKTPRHPHTNMAKAALNMLVRTSAADLARARIYAVAVDTGWITDENPQLRRDRARAQGFCPPLDVLDGAARVYDPVVRGARGEPVFGVFLKDYRPADW